MKTLGIDIGTTTISSVVYDMDIGRCLHVGTTENNSFIYTGQEWEKLQDVSVIIEKSVRVVEKCLLRWPDIKAIGLTGQMHGILYLDREGTCISPLYTWQDERANIPCEDGKTITESIREKCGLDVPAGYGLATHLYNTEKGIVPDGAKSLCTIMDYLGMVLTGRKNPCIHISNAAGLGFFDVAKGVFDIDSIRMCGMDPMILPEITDQVMLLGYHKGIPVMTALGDNQASFKGAVGEEINTYLINIGTGAQISVLSDRYYEAPGSETRPFSGSRYLIAGSSLCGGRAYAMLENFFRSYLQDSGQQCEPQYDVMEILARNRNQSLPELTVQTTFRGTRENPSLRGSITNIGEDNLTPGNLIYGVLKGMVSELYEMYGSIYRSTGKEMRYLRVSGNAVRKNQVLKEIIRETFMAEPVMVENEEEAACGAALFAAENC